MLVLVTNSITSRNTTHITVTLARLALAPTQIGAGQKPLDTDIIRHYLGSPMHLTIEYRTIKKLHSWRFSMPSLANKGILLLAQNATDMKAYVLCMTYTPWFCRTAIISRAFGQSSKYWTVCSQTLTPQKTVSIPRHRDNKSWRGPVYQEYYSPQKVV